MMDYLISYVLSKENLILLAILRTTVGYTNQSNPFQGENVLEYSKLLIAPWCSQAAMCTGRRLQKSWAVKFGPAWKYR